MEGQISIATLTTMFNELRADMERQRTELTTLTSNTARQMEKKVEEVLDQKLQDAERRQDERIRGLEGRIETLVIDSRAGSRVVSRVQSNANSPSHSRLPSRPTTPDEDRARLSQEEVRQIAEQVRQMPMFTAPSSPWPQSTAPNQTRPKTTESSEAVPQPDVPRIEQARIVPARDHVTYDFIRSRCIERFSGTGSKIEPLAWIEMFDEVSSQLNGTQRVQALASYVTGDAITWYSQDVAKQGLDWTEVRQRFLNRYGTAIVHPLATATNKHKLRHESIQAYANEKYRLCRLAKIPLDGTLALLTQGLPQHYRNMLGAAQPGTFDAWLKVALFAEDSEARSQPQRNFRTRGFANAAVTNV